MQGSQRSPLHAFCMCRSPTETPLPGQPAPASQQTQGSLPTEARMASQIASCPSQARCRSACAGVRSLHCAGWTPGARTRCMRSKHAGPDAAWLDAVKAVSCTAHLLPQEAAPASLVARHVPHERVAAFLWSVVSRIVPAVGT